MNEMIYSFLRSQMKASPWQATWELPLRQAHRGYHLGGVTENTIESLIAARQRGAKMCEFDVRLTKDNVVVLFHDPDLQRLTGQPGQVHDLTLRELSGYMKVSTLESVLRSPLVTDYLNIEIKSEEIWNDPLERYVAEVVKKTKAENRILFSSFNPFSLWKMQTLLPMVPRALLAASDLENRYLRELALAPFLSLQALHFDQVMLPNAEVIRGWQKKGFRVSVWTVDDENKIQDYEDWGVDSIISDLVPDLSKKP